MPLNIQDSEDPRKASPARPAAPLPPPQEETRGGIAKILLWVFALVVIASLVFLLMQFGIIPGGSEKSGGPAPAPSGDSARPAVSSADTATRIVPPAVKKGDSERAAELRQRLAGSEGGLTIFISAFNSAEDADELARRWERAGYQSFVQHTGGWYRVALGRYATVAAAREDAEKLRQALEDGYWIGSVATD